MKRLVDAYLFRMQCRETEAKLLSQINKTLQYENPEEEDENLDRKTVVAQLKQEVIEEVEPEVVEYLEDEIEYEEALEDYVTMVDVKEEGELDSEFQLLKNVEVIDDDDAGEELVLEEDEKESRVVLKEEEEDENVLEIGKEWRGRRGRRPMHVTKKTPKPYIQTRKQGKVTMRTIEDANSEDEENLPVAPLPRSQVINHPRPDVDFSGLKMCCQCSFESFDLEECREHFAAQHSTILIGKELKGAVQCPLCYQLFETEENLDLHMRKSLNLYCYPCDRYFNSKLNHAKHMSLHKGNYFDCEHCGKLFKSYNTFKSHIANHERPRKHLCTLCGERFTRNHELVEHINKHRNIKPYQCDICKMTFLRRYYLIKHMRVHTGND